MNKLYIGMILGAVLTLLLIKYVIITLLLTGLLTFGWLWKQSQKKT